MKKDLKKINSNREIEFSQYIEKIFKQLGFETLLYESNRLYDYVFRKNDYDYYVNIKYSKFKNINKDILKHKIDKNIKQNGTFITITTSFVPGRHTQGVYVNSDTLIIDIVDLLYIVQDNDKLKSELVSFIDFNINDIELSRSDSLKSLGINKLEPFEISFSDYIGKLEKWDTSSKNRELSTKFEELCTDVLKVLFSDDLTLWKIQEKSNRDLYRFDLVCRIKDNITTGFWNLLENRFNSKYVVFEFKNYAQKITQKEIYTTEKYLYLKALRSVAFIISKNGASNNAEIAIRGCLRENGKLIVSLTIGDLIEMLEKKSKGFDPSEYLYDILDSMLLDLEK